LALQCELAECTAHIGTKFLKLRPYKTTVIQSLLPPDCAVRIQYCRWFQESVFKGLLTQNLHLILTRCGTENPHAVHEVPLHDLKVRIWSVISAWRTIQPMSFHKTVNSKHYVGLILSPFLSQLTDLEKSYRHFMQDIATAHTANNSVVALDEVFGERVIS
jgi:hypothetical protein